MALALPTGDRGKLLAVGLVLVAFVLFWLGIVAPLASWYGDRAQRLSLLRLRVAHEAAQVELLPSLKQQAALASGTPMRAVLAGDTDATAGAALQEQVQSMASSAGVQLTSIETLPGEQVGQYRRIGVRVEANAQLPVLITMLRAIEQAQPAMKIDDIRLTATPIGPQNLQLPLDGAFTVYAFRVGTAKDEAQ